MVCVWACAPACCGLCVCARAGRGWARLGDTVLWVWAAGGFIAGLWARMNAHTHTHTHTQTHGMPLTVEHRLQRVPQRLERRRRLGRRQQLQQAQALDLRAAAHPFFVLFLRLSGHLAVKFTPADASQGGGLKAHARRIVSASPESKASPPRGPKSAPAARATRCRSKCSRGSRRAAPPGAPAGAARAARRPHSRLGGVHVCVSVEAAGGSSREQQHCGKLQHTCVVPHVWKPHTHTHTHTHVENHLARSA